MCDRDVAANDRAARLNREQFRDHDVAVVRVMGSPASGRTALLEAAVRALAPAVRVGILAAEASTDFDAVRLRAAGAEAIAVPTGTACHLDADMVRRAIRVIPWRECAYLFIEEIGSLTCPAVYDLGQSVSVVTLSAAQGADTPLKYTTMFHKADLVVLTMIDLASGRDAIERVRDNLLAVMPRPALLPVSAKTGVGIDQWVRWVMGLRSRRSAPCAIGVVAS